jgi:hypothetical protein
MSVKGGDAERECPTRTRRRPGKLRRSADSFSAAFYLETSVFLFTAPTHMHPNVERTGDAIHFQGMNGSYDVMVASTDEQED